VLWGHPTCVGAHNPLDTGNPHMAPQAAQRGSRRGGYAACAAGAVSCAGTWRRWSAHGKRPGCPADGIGLPLACVREGPLAEQPVHHLPGLLPAPALLDSGRSHAQKSDAPHPAGRQEPIVLALLRKRSSPCVGHALVKHALLWVPNEAYRDPGPWRPSSGCVVTCPNIKRR
jgi:hypothetical protein